MPNEHQNLSLTAYAARRGVSVPSVREAIATGRIARSVVMVAGKPKIADADLADREWLENTRSTARNTARREEADVPSIALSRARLEAAKAAIATLDLEERQGKLVPIESVRLAVTEKFAAVKTTMLGLPSRIKQRMPHISAEDVRVIDGMVREALEGLSGVER